METSSPSQLLDLARREPPATRSFFYDGVIFDMDGTLCACAIDFEDMRKRTGIPSGDLFTVMEAWTDAQQIKAAMDVILEIEAGASQRVTAKPGLVELLTMLREHKVHVALVTRNTSASVGAFFDLIGPDLASVFSPVLTREFDYVKPDRRLLLHIAQMWNADPSRLLMVGDSLEDVEVGNAAGTATCLIAGGGNEAPGAAPAAPPVGAAATFAVSGLEELRVQLEQAAALTAQAGELLLSASTEDEEEEREGEGGSSVSTRQRGRGGLRRVDLTGEDEEEHEAAAAAHAVQLARQRVLEAQEEGRPGDGDEEDGVSSMGRVGGDSPGVAADRRALEQAMAMDTAPDSDDEGLRLGSASSMSSMDGSMAAAFPAAPSSRAAAGDEDEEEAAGGSGRGGEFGAQSEGVLVYGSGHGGPSTTVLLSTRELVPPLSGRVRLGWPALVAGGEQLGAEGAPPPGLQFLDWLVDNGALRPGVCSFPVMGAAAGGLATCPPDQRGDRVLHLCCGQGGLTKMVASQGMRVVGVDVDVAAAQRRGLTAVPFTSPRPLTSRSLLAARALAGPRAFDVVLLCCEDQEGGCGGGASASGGPGGRHPVLDQWWSGEALQELQGLMHDDSRLCAEVTLPSNQARGAGGGGGAGANPAAIINSINSSGLTVVAWQLLRSPAPAAAATCSTALFAGAAAAAAAASAPAAAAAAAGSAAAEEAPAMQTKLRLVARRHILAL